MTTKPFIKAGITLCAVAILTAAARTTYADEPLDDLNGIPPIEDLGVLTEVGVWEQDAQAENPPPASVAEQPAAPAVPEPAQPAVTDPGAPAVQLPQTGTGPATGVDATWIVFMAAITGTGLVCAGAVRMSVFRRE
jgi:hypothetical protein